MFLFDCSLSGGPSIWLSIWSLTTYKFMSYMRDQDLASSKCMKDQDLAPANFIEDQDLAHNNYMEDQDLASDSCM